MLKFIKDRRNDFNANYFINEMAEASKKLGILEAKISDYHFDGILIPMFHKKEAISSMSIEGTQTTLSDIFENEVNPKSNSDKAMIEVKNHAMALGYGAANLNIGNFSNGLIKEIHEILMTGIVSSKKISSLGKYKQKDNYIVNGARKIIFTPPSHTETLKYMDELLSFMNKSNDDLNPLIKAAIIHSQFESIHPFEDGNGRVGRILVSLYLYKAKVINFPFFYISEAISQDKVVYYSKLTSTREGDYNEWIQFFLRKVVVQADKHISYIDSLNELYEKTKNTLKEIVNSPQYDNIIGCLFTHPVLTSSYLADKLEISSGQAKRYLDILEKNRILFGDDKMRNRTYYFIDLLELARRT